MKRQHPTNLHNHSGLMLERPSQTTARLIRKGPPEIAQPQPARGSVTRPQLVRCQSNYRANPMRNSKQRETPTHALVCFALCVLCFVFCVSVFHTHHTLQNNVQPPTEDRMPLSKETAKPQSTDRKTRNRKTKYKTTLPLVFSMVLRSFPKGYKKPTEILEIFETAFRNHHCPKTSPTKS